MRQRGLPPAQALLGQRRGGEEVAVGRLTLEPHLVGLERPGVIALHLFVVVAQGELTLSTAGRERRGALGRSPSCLRHRWGRGADVVVVGLRPGQLRPGLGERRIEHYGLLIEACSGRKGGGTPTPDGRGTRPAL